MLLVFMFQPPVHRQVMPELVVELFPDRHFIAPVPLKVNVTIVTMRLRKCDGEMAAELHVPFHANGTMNYSTGWPGTIIGGASGVFGRIFSAIGCQTAGAIITIPT